METYAFTLRAGRSIGVPPGSAIFVRSGLLIWQTRNGHAIVDANHALLIPSASGPSRFEVVKSNASLTIFFEPRADFGDQPSLRLLDSDGYLQLHRLGMSVKTSNDIFPLQRIANDIRATAPVRGLTPRGDLLSYADLMQIRVNTTLTQPLRLREIAGACSLSPFTASRVFHREAGIPLRRYAIRLRLRTALGMIASGGELSRIAQELGFFDHAHFTKAFRAEFGMAPSEWQSTTHYKTCEEHHVTLRA